jgi:2',3'-cyclic-nucleotide 2'-phosphodiesterase (5'-nucleotidase family)
MRPLRSAPAVPLLLALLLLAAPARAEHVRISVLHTTDLHGALTAYDYAYDRPAARGLTKIATLVKAVRAAGRS